MNERLEESVQSRFEDAKARHQAGKLAQAVEAYSRIVNLDPKHFQAHNNLGTALDEIGESAGAIASFERALAIAPDSPTIHYNLANALHKMGDYQGAETAYRRALELDPTAPETHFNLGNTLLEQNRMLAAATALREAARLAPDQAAVHSRLGDALRLTGDLAGAETAYRAAVAIEPAAALEHLQLGVLMDVLCRHTEAEACYREALALDPRFGSAYECLGRLLNNRGRLSEAESVYRAWLEARPDDPAARHMLAAVTGSDPKGRAGDDYVRQTFDSFASTFDATLTQLDYRAPQLICASLFRSDEAAEPRLTILDVGCGTGLCGPGLRPHAQRLVGIDLSPAMLAKARQRGIYDALECTEITAFLGQSQEQFDVLVASDTLVYFGALDTVLSGAQRVLGGGGRLVFTLEAMAEEEHEAGFRLNAHGRYSHTETYTASAVAASGLQLLSIAAAALRRESGRPVAGFVVLARKPST